MNVLEKILEEIEERKQEHLCNAELEIEETVNRMEELNWVCALIYYMEEVKKANVQTNDDWIPCSERLPEKNVKELYDMQLVTLKDGEVCLGVYRNEDDEWWTRKQEGERVYTNTHEVIAWKPLPEPYRAADKPDWEENMLNTFLAGH